MYGPEILDLFDLLVPFFWGPLQNHGHKMAAGATRVTSSTLHCRQRRSHPRQPYICDSSGSSPNVTEMTVVADNRVIHHSVVSLIPVGVCVTSRILHSNGRRGHLPHHYIPHSSSCFCDLQEIMSLQTTVAHSYSKRVALSVMRFIRWDMNGIHVSTIRNLVRREGSD